MAATVQEVVTPASRPRRAVGSSVPTVVAIVAVLGVWELLGRTVYGRSKTIPPWTGILAMMKHDGWGFYGPNVATTFREALQGYAWGVSLAVAVAVAIVLIRPLEWVAMPIALATYCLPAIAIGPVLGIIQSGDSPKVTLAALSVFYTTLIGALLGLRSADRTSLELVRAYGGGSWVQLRKVRLRAALPATMAALRIAAPAAVLGAIIGEWVGANNGIGVAMIASQSGYHIERTWGLAFAATAMSGLGYLVVAVVGNRLTSWAPRVPR